MRKNDVFRWSYKNTGSMYMPYHCKSQICIAKQREDGYMYLEDTYWGSHSSNLRFSLKEAEESLELKFLGNLDDFEEKSEMETCYFSSKDIMDLSHSNSRKQIYIRKGAKKNLNKMRKVIEANIEEYRKQAENALWSANKLREDLKNLTEDSYVYNRHNIYIDETEDNN